MRSLIQPQVLKAAAAGAAITTLASYPRLVLWTERPHQLWFLTLTLAWTTFILWSFVFAWSPKYAGRPVVAVQPTFRSWSAATAAGLAGVLVLGLIIDPVLRPLVPGDYPTNIESWLAFTCFVLAFDQLFLCFAPLAFFLRLTRKPATAASLTVLFGVVLVYIKARTWPDQFTSLFIIELFAWRVTAGFLSVFFFFKGGVLLNAWWILLLQFRHLIFFGAAQG